MPWISNIHIHALSQEISRIVKENEHLKLTIKGEYCIAYETFDGKNHIISLCNDSHHKETSAIQGILFDVFLVQYKKMVMHWIIIAVMLIKAMSAKIFDILLAVKNF